MILQFSPQVRIENASVYCQGKRLCSTEPLLEARQKLSCLSISDWTLVVLCSPLAGAGLNELLQKMPAHSALALLEFHPELIQLFLKQSGIQDSAMASDPRLYMPRPFEAAGTELSPEAYVLDISRLFARGLRRVLCISFHGGRRIFPQEYQLVETLLEEELQRYWRNQSTILFMAQNWMRNSLRNLSHVHRASPLPSLPDKDLLLVGAGPSLDLMDSILLKPGDNIVTMAVDTALPALMARGIRPDFVVVLESQHVNLRDFLGADLSDTHLLVDLSAAFSPLRYRPCKGLSIFASRFTPCAWWKLLDAFEHESGVAIPRIPPLGSVGLAALHLAALMQPRNLYIAGLDFCFEPGKTHARHSPALIHHLSNSSRFTGYGSSGLGSQDFPLSSQETRAAHGSNARGTILYSSPVLAAYGQDARLLLMRTMKSIPVWDIRPQGLELGIPPGETQFPHGKNSQQRRILPSQEPPNPQKAALVFSLWQNLLNELSTLIRELDAFLPRLSAVNNMAEQTDPSHTSTAAQELASFVLKLEDFDFLLLRIPAHKRSGPAYLVLARLELWYWQRYLGKLIHAPHDIE